MSLGINIKTSSLNDLKMKNQFYIQLSKKSFMNLPDFV